MKASRKMVLTLLVAALVSVACSSSKVLVPPRVDLRDYGTIGLVSISSAPEQALGQMASEELLTCIQAAQPGVPVLELGDEAKLLAEVGRPSIDPETIQAIGKAYKVDAVVFGTLTAKEVQPRISLDTAAGAVQAKAEVEGNLVARLCDVRNGATLWTRTAAAREPVAQVRVGRGGVAGGGGGKSEAHGRLVQSLVARVTDDFWSHWE